MATETIEARAVREISATETIAARAAETLVTEIIAVRAAETLVTETTAARVAAEALVTETIEARAAREALGTETTVTRAVEASVTEITEEAEDSIKTVTAEMEETIEVREEIRAVPLVFPSRIFPASLLPKSPGSVPIRIKINTIINTTSSNVRKRDRDVPENRVIIIPERIRRQPENSSNL